MKNTKKAIITGMRKVIDAFYPPRCPICDEISEGEERICPQCRTKLYFIAEPVCKKCSKPLENEQKEYCYDCTGRTHAFEAGKAVFDYRGEMRKSLYRFKYGNKREYAYFYARETVKQYGNWIKERKIEAIIPIPLHQKRKQKRGYNQAELYARFLGEMLELPVLTKVIYRVKETRPQKELDDSGRKNNLKKAFKTTANIVQLPYILLVDDIYTTGSTMDAAAQVLKNAGVQKIFCICISIGRGL